MADQVCVGGGRDCCCGLLPWPEMFIFSGWYLRSGETPCLPQRDYPRVTPLDQNVADNHIPGVI